uniref:CSON012239 protein n=1 Tax=Culicoides sonorensis TaxID=179676 RepID=A0A336KJA6_CULSO
MVMDAQPSPQCVGREFVRQYYTLLNKAPDHLHSNRDAPIVVGQKSIHNKIQQLNFRDCHAKISQVDSQATLGGGVVVQVTGELSNAGQPMRRFTQTFVLAAQSPKKYYVHNDIFRYQDLYSEDELEENGRSEADEEISQEIDTNNVELNQLNNQQTIYYSSNVLTSAPNVLPNYTQQQQQPLQANQQQQQQQLNGHEETTDTQTVINNTVQAVETNVVSEPKPTPFIEPEEPAKAPTPVDVTVFETPAVEEKPEPIVSAPVVSNEPKTWSNLVKTGGMSSTVMSMASTISNTTNNTIASTVTPSSATTNKFPSDSISNRFDPPLGATGPGLSQKQSLPQRVNRERRTSNTNVAPQNQQFNDNQQLFLGNIPHHATDEDLKVLFSRFGTVVDLRILSKQGQPKVPGQRPPPNYGFITYEDPAAVQECLANLPLYFPENSPEGQKLNVEEKKTRTRAPGETGGRIGLGNSQQNRNGPSGANSGLNRGPPGNQRGGNAGGAGQNRGSSFNRDRGGQPLGQRNAGNVNNNNSNNTYSRR